MKALKALLVAGALALLASTGAAEAKTKTTTISFDGYCDVVTLKVTGTFVAGKDSCAGGFGGGMVAKVAGFGNAIVAGVQFTPYPGYQFVLELSYPLVSGGTWNLYYTTDGKTLNAFESGTYSVSGAAMQGPRGSASIVSAPGR